MTVKKRTFVYLESYRIVHILLMVSILWACHFFHRMEDRLLWTAGGVALSLLLGILVRAQVRKTLLWYERILDTIPFMMHATDLDMNWIFMNRATEAFLDKGRDAVTGMHCSNWGAAICNTEQCAAYCLRCGNSTTFFAQNGKQLRVDTNWLLDSRKNRVGYLEIVQDITTMVERQNKQSEMVDMIEASCGTFVGAAKQLANAAQMVAQGSVAQSSAVQAVSEQVDLLAGKIDGNRRQSDQAADRADEILQSAKMGLVMMGDLARAVEEIATSTQSIREIIHMIDEVAFQTNILSLNAAVEAARAGYYGAGFAVVADEVRTLAARSAKAAKDSAELISGAMERIAAGEQIAADTARYFETITGKIQSSKELVSTVAGSSQEQSEAIARINADIAQVSQIAQQNSSIAQETAAASTQMLSQTQMVRQLLNHFQDHTGGKGVESEVEENVD